MAADVSRQDVLVVDNGTGYIKAGYANDNIPRHTFPSIVGRPTLRAEEDLIDSVTLKDIMVGDEAAANRKALEISYPVENGIIRNWDDMEHVWNHLFAERFCTSPRGKKILLTEAPMNPAANKKKMIEVMFEKYQFDGMQIETQAILTLYAMGRRTGVVLDSGDGVTHIVVVVEGYVFPHLVRRLDVAGRHITRHLIKLLLARGYAFNRTSDFQTVADMKEKLCYVALDPKREQRLAEETTVLTEKYTLPDGRVIAIGPERYQAAEALFNPSLVDVESPGMADLVWEVIQGADTDTRPELYKSIVLSGGTTMYPGLPSRLEHDLKNRYLNDICKGDAKRAAKFGKMLNIDDPPRRRHAVFEGASVLAGIYADREDYWMTKRQYEEEGAERLVGRVKGLSIGGGR